MIDVAVVGGGPAGLAVAIEAARRGLETVVLERSREVPDKACGEGLMPGGVRALEALGARALLSPEDCAPFAGIRYVQAGASVAARFPRGPGLGVRRTSLVAALETRARALGVDVRRGCVVNTRRLAARCAVLETDAGPLEARVVVAADGLGSPLRSAAGLEGEPARGRFGLRQHVRLAPWSPYVEVHWSEGVEAYVTPVGRERVNVAFLWDPRTLGARASFEEFLARFPALERHVRGAPVDSTARGLGPLVRTSRARVAPRLVLVGDAAGFIDGIAGEGIALAFRCASALGRLLPEAIARGAGRDALGGYERTYRREFARYALFTRGLLVLARYPAVRRQALRALARAPGLYRAALGRVSGPAPDF